MGMNLHLREASTDRSGWYATGWLSLTGFGNKESVVFQFDRVERVTLNGGLAAGVAVHGNAHFRIGLTYEYLSDTGINPFPERAHLMSVSITIIDPRVLW